MCISHDFARTTMPCEAEPLLLNPEWFAPDGSIDLSNPLVRLVPVSALARAIANAAIRNQHSSASAATQAEIEAGCAEAAAALSGSNVLLMHRAARHRVTP